MIGIVVVVYKSYERIVTYVSQELAKVTAPHRTVIVDVGSPRESSERIAQALGVSVWEEGMTAKGELFVLHADENLGYARGNNLGVEFLMRLFPDIDKLLFSNDDIELISPNVVEVLADRMDADDSIGCVGPKVVDLHGHTRFPTYAPPSPLQKAIQNIAEPILGARRPHFQHETEMQSGKVNHMEGCFMMIKANLFQKIGGFDKRTFLYWEEAILAKAIQNNGMCSFCVSEVTVKHFVGNSVKQNSPILLLLNCELFGQRLYFGQYAKVGCLAYGLLWLSGEVRLLLVHLALLKRWILGKDRKRK